MTPMSKPAIALPVDTSGPQAVAPVATAVPAFIGCTQRADDGHGQSLVGTPVRITSHAEFLAYFAEPDAAAAPARPQYHLVPQGAPLESTPLESMPLESMPPKTAAQLGIGSQCFAALPDPGTLYHLHRSVALFYANGGGDAWIVSAGLCGPATGQPVDNASTPPVNPNLSLAALLQALAALRDQTEPTLYVCPDATLLSPQDNATLMQAMLAQADALGTVLCLLDVINGDNPTADGYAQDIAAFRQATGSTGLDRGACYYPFIITNGAIDNSLDDAIDFTHLFGGDLQRLAAVLEAGDGPDPAVTSILASIGTAAPAERPALQRQLLAASATYARIMQVVQTAAATVPASGAMAGVYANNDNTRGVWIAPANVGIVGVTDLPFLLNDMQQGGLNVDAVTGKSINAIRAFTGLGILVWGARTLDGNSQDWRYVPVRRTMDYIDATLREIMRACVFMPNDGNTWSFVNMQASAFLTDLWKQGGLVGATASDAFTVATGLGTTMTAQDLLDGYMRLTAKVALTAPAEFLVTTLEQQMQSPSG